MYLRVFLFVLFCIMAQYEIKMCNTYSKLIFNRLGYNLMFLMPRKPTFSNCEDVYNPFFKAFNLCQ